MGGKPSRPTNGGLFGIHRIITRCIEKCAAEAEKAGAEGNKWSLSDLKGAASPRTARLADFLSHTFVILFLCHS